MHFILKYINHFFFQFWSLLGPKGQKLYFSKKFKLKHFQKIFCFYYITIIPLLYLRSSLHRTMRSGISGHFKIAYDSPQGSKG